MPHCKRCKETCKCTGNLKAECNLIVNKDALIKRNLTVNGTTTLNGSVTINDTLTAKEVDTRALCLIDRHVPPPVKPNEGCLFTLAGQPDTLNFQNNQGQVNQVAFTPALSTHNVTFQLIDTGPFPVGGTQFTVKVKAEKTPSKVTLYFPAIGFQVGQCSEIDPAFPVNYPPLGYVRTVAGQLPLELCPNQLTYQTAIAASHQGAMNAVPYLGQTIFAGNMELSQFEGYIAPTTFNGYIDTPHYLTVDPSSIVGPGLFVGSIIHGEGGYGVTQGTTIIEINPRGPNTYLLNNPSQIIPSPVPFTTQSVLVINSITSGAPPISGAILTGPGITNDTSMLTPILNEVNPDGTGLYFVATLSTTVPSAVSFPYTTLPVVSTAGFPTSGTLIVGPDIVNYTGISGNTFTGCSGGQIAVVEGALVQYSLTAGSSGSPISITAEQNTVLNVTQFAGGNPLRPGMTITGTGVAAGTTVIAFASGNGTIGSYIVSPPQTFSSTTLTSTPVIGDPVFLPSPPSGYQVMVGHMGDILIAGVGQFLNYLPAGNHNLKPFSMSYPVQKPLTLTQNIAVSNPFTNVTQFTRYIAVSDSLRDVHVTAAYGGKVVFSWADNSAQSDQSNNVMDCVIAIGNVVNGQLVMQPPVTLTNNIDNRLSWIFCTAAAINPTNPNNIVVSWAGAAGPDAPLFVPNRAVSMDGGLTWPIRGPTNLYPIGGRLGDCRGVSADKYGNIWYLTSNEYPPYITFNQPTWWVSPDGGVTFYVAYTVPPNTWPQSGWDTPQSTFTYDGNGNYGFFYSADYFTSNGQIPAPPQLDLVPVAGFVPITGKMSAATTANFTGSISGTVLTITSMTSGAIIAGQTLCGDNQISGVYLDPTTKIVSFGTGTGGIGTYNVNISQTVASSNIYASVLPIGPLPLSGNSTTVTVATTLPSATINVASTTGFPTVGTLLFPNGATVVYSSMTATAFTGCSAGYGTANVGDVIVQPSTPSYLFNFVNQQSISSVAAADDGRVWVTSQGEFVNVGMGTSIRFKSSATNSFYPDVVAANHSGNWIVAEAYGYYPQLNAEYPVFTAFASYPVFGYFNDDRVIVWDEPRQALYLVSQFGPLPGSQDMRIAFVISRDNGQSWSDLIYVANTFAANRGQANMTLDPVTGDLIFSWYDGRNDTTTYQNIQYFAGIMPAAQLTALVNDIPLSNPTYQSPNANVPGSYVITQVSSNTPSPNGPSNGTTFGSRSKSGSNIKGRMSRRHMRNPPQRP